MAQSILYYPSINIKDSLWLRNALLYWDNIYSIVPFENYDNFSPELAYLKSKNIYRPIYPTDIFAKANSENTMDEFNCTIYSRLISYQKKTSPNSNQNSLSLMENHVPMHKNKFFSPSINNFIHYRKIPESILNYLHNKGYIHDIDGNGWFEIDSAVASIYMKTLAEFTAKYSTQDIIIGTNQPVKLQEIFSNDRNRRDNSVCLSLIMKQCLPQPSMDTPLEDLVDFKEHQNYELLELRQKLRNFENILSQCQSPKELKSEMAAFKELWQISLNQSQELFNDCNIGYSLGTAKTLVEITGSTTVLLTAIREYAHSTVPNWLFSTTLSLSAAVGLGIAYINHKQHLKKQRSNSGFAYITNAYQQRLVHKTPFYETIDNDPRNS